MTVDVKVGVVQHNSRTTTGNQNFTIPGFGTPKAALFFHTSATNHGNGQERAVSRLSYGFTDGTRHRVYCNRSQNGVATTNCASKSASSTTLVIANASTSTIGEASWSAWTTDGITVNWSTAVGLPQLITCVLFGGDDLQAHVNDFQPEIISGDDIAVSAPGFKPDQVIFVSDWGAVGGALSDAKQSIGFADRGAADAITQFSRNFTDINGVGTSAYGIQLTNDYCLRRVANSAGSPTLDSAIELTSWDTTGFTVTTREGNFSGTEEVSYLALEYGGRDHWIGEVDSPTSIQNQETTAPGFHPQLVHILNSFTDAASLDSLVTDDDSSKAGCSATSGVCRQFSNSYHGRDNVGTTDTKNSADLAVCQLEDYTDTDILRGELLALTDTGFSIDWTVIDAAAKAQIALAVEATPVTIEEAETVEISDSVVMARTRLIIINETVQIADAVVDDDHPTVSVVLNETVQISDAAVLQTGMVPDPIEETVEISEGVLAVPLRIRASQRGLTLQSGVEVGSTLEAGIKRGITL